MTHKNLMAISYLITTVFLQAHAAVAAEPLTGDPVKGASVSAPCQSCHGNHGNQTAGAIIPKLAQQVAPYIDKQLHNFKAGDRKNSIMSSMAAPLTDTDIRNIAAYFSDQRIVPDKGADAAQVEAGKKVYSSGVAATLVPACSSCHGPQGAGVTPSYPRLAGQHAQYLVLQLRNFKAGDRANDSNGVMRDIAAKLTDDQITAVAGYLSVQ